MGNDTDHLSNEVSVLAVVTESGVTAKTKSRAVAAIDRLVGALADVPAAKLEAYANSIRRKDRQDTLVSDATIQLYLDDPSVENAEHMARLLRADTASRLTALANKGHVVQRAVEHLVLPNPNAQTKTNSDADEVDADWLNYFDGYAEKASSDKVRDLWGRILTGEIRRPGSFALMTLRLMSELDRDMAMAFEQEAAYRVEGSYLIQPEDKDLVGQRFLTFKFLEEVGLLHAVSSAARSFKPDSDGFCWVREGKFYLRFNTKGEINLRVIRFTRAGQELSTILEPVDPCSVLEKLGRTVLLHGSIETMELRQIVGASGSSHQTSLVKTLK
ncbi:MAG: DUF2806 domain-containing protein [Gammaproteobacteria bacterium]|nr:DUF2806 domain-containing protein [Gammaproteobacteria bacterium]